MMNFGISDSSDGFDSGSGTNTKANSVSSSVAGINGSYDSKGNYDSSEGSDSSDASVNGDSADLSNASDLQPVKDADSWGSLQLRIEQWLRESATAITLDDVAGDTDPGELQSRNHPYQVCHCTLTLPLPLLLTYFQNFLHKAVTASDDIVTDCTRLNGSGFALGCNIGADPLAGNALDGADTAPRIHSEIDTTVTARHDINNTHNIRGVKIPHVSPSGDADSGLYDDGPAVQLAPPPKHTRTSIMRSFTPFTSLIPQASTTPRPSLPTVEDIWGSFGSPISGIGAPAASRHGQCHRLVSSSSTGDQDDDSAVD
ncbi:hypothetical protein AAF712_008999 [Marasmius tenuissimus]|uniref:Uncharacterized protein n=1 Tax=Marasmius tenuissimus TaxID=585030 RepID=A0ABR2ZRP4_9AGAR